MPGFLRAIRKLNRDGLLRVDIDRRQPSKAVRTQPVGDAEELVRQLLRDRAGLAVGDRDAVHASGSA